ncbi:MAG: hypothetical protein FJ104_15230, partial [Deltaproteobacteria bacterium]|nr:hypothetical protein [Deltaproteobacteria bacterium]
MRTVSPLRGGPARPAVRRLAVATRRRMGWLGAVAVLACGEAGSGDDRAAPGRELTPEELAGMGG